MVRNMIKTVACVAVMAGSASVARAGGVGDLQALLKEYKAKLSAVQAQIAEVDRKIAVAEDYLQVLQKNGPGKDGERAFFNTLEQAQFNLFNLVIARAELVRQMDVLTNAIKKFEAAIAAATQPKSTRRAGSSGSR